VGIPEPYTRTHDLSPGYSATGNEELADALRRTLVALAPIKRRAWSHHSRTILLTVAPAIRRAVPLWPGIVQKSANEPEFLDGQLRTPEVDAIQSPDDMVMVSQLPTSDWRDDSG